MKRKTEMKGVLSCLLALVLVFSITPSVFAEGTGTTIYVDAINGDDAQPGVGTASDKAYKTVAAAVAAAESGNTIMLAAGTYTLYGKDDVATNKSLTFVGADTQKTTWYIGTLENDAHGQSNGDYGFRGAKTLIFRNMTLKAGVTPSGTVAGGRDYMGFAHTDKTIVENCVIEGKTFYWGYTSATFKNTTFNCPNGDYAIWTYSSPEMTFDNCTFNSSGKVINVYTDYGAGKHDITVNYNDCVVNSNTPEEKKDKAVMNINDSNMADYKYIINISGNNTVNGVTPDNLNEEYPKGQKDITCSRLFEFNTKYGNGNSGRTVVSIDGIKVWENGNMIAHERDTANDSYTDGYKDNAYTITNSDWKKTDDDYYIRVVKKVCDYCGYPSEYKEKGYSVTYTDGVDNVEIFKDQTTIVLANDVTPAFGGGTPTRDGYIFDGWNPDVNETVTRSITYTAAWKEKVVPTDPTTPPDPTRPTETNPDTGVTSPQTGDNSNLALWFALLLVSGGAVTATTVYGRKKKRSVK